MNGSEQGQLGKSVRSPGHCSWRIDGLQPETQAEAGQKPRRKRRLHIWRGRDCDGGRQVASSLLRPDFCPSGGLYFFTAPVVRGLPPVSALLRFPVWSIRKESRPVCP